MKNIKLLLCSKIVEDSSSELNNGINDVEAEPLMSGFSLITCPHDGGALINSIEVERPNFVIMDLFMPNFDAIGVMRETRHLNAAPKYIVCSTYSTPLLEREVKGEGAYLFKHSTPISLSSIVSEISELSNSIGDTSKMSGQDANLLVKVSEILYSLGVPPHIKGYQYLRESIIMVCNNPDLLHYITKMLYPQIAEKFEVSSARVERAIRHAIEIAWDRCDKNVLAEYFSTSISYGKGRPTNSEFIAVLADRIMLEDLVKA